MRVRVIGHLLVLLPLGGYTPAGPLRLLVQLAPPALLRLMPEFFQEYTGLLCTMREAYRRKLICLTCEPIVHKRNRFCHTTFFFQCKVIIEDDSTRYIIIILLFILIVHYNVLIKIDYIIKKKV